MTHAGPRTHRLTLAPGSLAGGEAAGRLLAEARAAIAAGASAIVIDFGGVAPGGGDLRDPREIAALSELRGRLPPHVRVALAALPRAAARTARATHLHELFDIYADARAAVDDLSS